jgi:phosphoenolpyruvate carboxykinase (ATP)
VDPQKVLRNLPYAEIFDRELKQMEGVVTKNGTFCVSTGKFTGRSPKDKYFVKQVKPALHQSAWLRIHALTLFFNPLLQLLAATRARAASL